MSPLPKQTRRIFHEKVIVRRRTVAEEQENVLREKFGGSGRNERVPRFPFLDIAIFRELGDEYS